LICSNFRRTPERRGNHEHIRALIFRRGGATQMALA
jgi:hypothetical protein